jgi:hypothetical protein
VSDTIKMRVEKRKPLYWKGFLTALFLLIVVDGLLTFFAVSRFGLVVESNPIVALLLQNIEAFVSVNFIVTAGSILLFKFMLSQLPYVGEKTLYIFELFIVVGITTGLLLASNNILFIFTGDSLIHILSTLI